MAPGAPEFYVYFFQSSGAVLLQDNVVQPVAHSFN